MQNPIKMSLSWLYKRKFLLQSQIKSNFECRCVKILFSNGHNAREMGMPSAAREAKRHRAEIPINDDAPILRDS